MVTLPRQHVARAPCSMLTIPPLRFRGNPATYRQTGKPSDTWTASKPQHCRLLGLGHW